MVPRLQNQVQRVARVVEKTFNLRYLGQYDWGLFEARAYDEKVKPLFMDFGPDKRFWYGPGALPAGSGGDHAVNCSTCSPIAEPAR
jgi:iron complex outermembrane receptor protein